jgi:hypothetical protein
MHTSAAQSRLRPHSHHHAGRRAAAAASAATAAKPKLYNPRHPERTLLYQTTAEHFETWFELASAGQFDGQGDHHTPKPYVRKAFRKYLECGIFAHGFARARCDAYGHDYFVAFSCKGRGVCPSCNTRRMVETAAHLTDHVFPRLPVRQWVLSVPKRLRYFMQRDGAVLGMVLRIFLRVIAQTLQANSPGAANVDKAALHIGAIAFIHRFGSSLNEHVHFHVCAVDGVFEEVAGEGDADAHAQARAPGVIFRPATGVNEITLTPLELIDRIAALVPPPRTHRHRYFGVLAPNSLLRAAVMEMAQSTAVQAPQLAQGRADSACTGAGMGEGAHGVSKPLPTQPEPAQPVPPKRPAHYLWAVLIARIYEVFPLLCPICGGQMRIIAFITYSADIRQILEHIGADAEPPRITPARGPPLWDGCDVPMGEGVEVVPDWDEAPQPAPDFEVDQRVSW